MLGSDPSSGMAVGANCEVGYEEFPIDDETSTCVFESLVEPNCYRGSAPRPDVLGGSDVCLYYPRDRFQPDGSCRANYDRVYFLGQWRCRWDELESDQLAWYTLLKDEEEEEEDGDDIIFSGVAESCVTLSPITAELDSYCKTLMESDMEFVSREVTAKNECTKDLTILLDSRFWDDGSKSWEPHGWLQYVRPGETITMELDICRPIETPPSFIIGICAEFTDDRKSRC